VYSPEIALARNRTHEQDPSQFVIEDEKGGRAMTTETITSAVNHIPLFFVYIK